MADTDRKGMEPEAERTEEAVPTPEEEVRAILDEYEKLHPTAQADEAVPMTDEEAAGVDGGCDDCSKPFGKGGRIRLSNAPLYMYERGNIVPSDIRATGIYTVVSGVGYPWVIIRRGDADNWRLNSYFVDRHDIARVYSYGTL